MMDETSISLFSCGGIGDLAMRAAGLSTLISNELEHDRHSVFAWNFPETKCLTGDIHQRVTEIISETRKLLSGRELTVLFATPPCQGMSKNGRGKLLNGIRAGLKPALDPRNQLILPTLQIASALRPEILLFENVPEMATTSVVAQDGKLVPIMDLVHEVLGPAYDGKAEVVEFADYGVPQCRQRLITVFTRNPRLLNSLQAEQTLLPPATHSEFARHGLERWVTLRDAIEDTPPLDASTVSAAASTIPFHCVPLLDAEKYWWVEHTEPGRSAFDNQCVECGCRENPTHQARRDDNGINRTSTETPLFCVECGARLPRPCVKSGDDYRLMRGFTSAYKRMQWDRPASALTRNLSYACSDNKLHPEQHRVLSLYEAFRVHTLDRYDFDWQRQDGRPVSDKLVRELIGESVPPLGLQRIVEHLLRIRRGEVSSHDDAQLGGLFAVSRRESASPDFVRSETRCTPARS